MKLSHFGFDPERWARVRARGRRRFVLVSGVAGWGLSMFVVLGVLLPWLQRQHERLTPLGLAISAVVWLVAGVVFGVLTWHFSEKTYLSRKPE